MKIVRLAAVALLVSCSSLPPVGSPSRQGNQPGLPGQDVLPQTANKPDAGPVQGLDGGKATLRSQGRTDTLTLLMQFRRPPGEFHTERLELEKIRRLRAWVTGPGIGSTPSDRIMNLNDYIQTSSTPGAQTSLQIQQVPRGRFRVVTVQGYDVSGQTYPEVPGATLKALYDSPAQSTEVVLNFSWRSTLEAEVFEALLADAANNPALMQMVENLSRSDLGALLDKLTYGTTPPEGSSLVLHPNRVNGAGIAESIVDANGQIPSYTPGSQPPANWLKSMSDVSLVVRTPQQNAFSASNIQVQITDPASDTVVISNGNDTAALPKIVPGNWQAIVHIDGLNGGVTTRANVQIDSNGQAILTEGTNANPIILPPVIKQLSQTQAASGTQITLSGDGFNAAVAANNLVKFGSTPATVLLATATSLVVTVPPGITGTLPITVTSNGKTSNQGDFTVSRAITSVSNTGVHTGDSLTLNLSGLDLTQDNTAKVTFTGGTEATITARTASTVTVTVPAGAQSGPVTLTPGTGSTLQSPTVYVNEPRITSFGPATGGAGTEITVTGLNLDTVTSLSIGGVTVPSANLTPVDAQTLKVTVPANALTGPISVTNPAGTATSATNFTMTLAIISLSSNSGLIGSSLTLNTAGFNPQNTPSTVVFSGGAQATVTGSTATSITVQVPAGAQSGPITVTPQGNAALQSPSFSVLVPAVVSLSSPGGFVGNSLTVNVTGFNPQTTPTTVTFAGGVQATVTGSTASSLTVLVPAGAVTGPLTLTPQNLTAIQSPTYTINDPVITSVTNSGGQTLTQVAKNQQIVITGVNFNNASSVCFDTVCTSSFTRVGDVISVTVPGTVTSGPLKVVTPFGTATSNISIMQPPLITTLAPPDVSQQSLTIQGSSFSPVTQVTIGGQAVNPADLTINSDSSITVNNLPDNPVLGTITVTNPAGTAVASLTYKNLLNFIGDYTRAPNTVSHSADFCGAHGINVDGNGNVFVADIGCNYSAPFVSYGYHNSIHKFDKDGNHIWSTGSNAMSTFGAPYYGRPGFADGPIADATLSSPEDVANDAAGNLYVADTNNHAIRKITTTGQVVTLARLPGPEGLEITTDGKLYVTGNYPPNPTSTVASNLAYVLRIDDLNTVPANLATLPYNPNDAVETNRWSSNVTKLAGGNISLTPATATASPASSARFTHLEGLGIDGQNRVYIADQDAYQIRRYDPATNEVTIFASMSSATPSASSPTVQVHEIRVDRAGNVFVPSPSLSPSLGIYLINPAGKISLIAGSSTGASGLADGDPIKQATFTSPRGIDFGPDGSLYVADTAWGVRKIERYHPAFNLQMP